jgi:hypothetical protein
VAQGCEGVVVEGGVGCRAQGRADGWVGEDAGDGDAVVLGLGDAVAVTVPAVPSSADGPDAHRHTLGPHHDRP